LDYCASDIRIADFWGPKYATNNDGVSLVIVNTSKGKKIWEEVNDKLTVEKCSFEDLEVSQPKRYFSIHSKRAIISKAFKSNKSLDKIYNKYFKIIILRRRLSYINKWILKRI